MFFATKVQVISGMVIGALAVVAAKQMCKRRKLIEHSPEPANLPQG